MDKLLTEQNYKDAAGILLCEVACIHAVADVESSGAGFFNDGSPKILFEAHSFHNLTKGVYDKEYPNISSPVWNKALYKGGIKEYDRLNLAKSLDETAALQSASWGKFQIMGSNFKSCGYPNVQQFVTDMYIDESKHLKAFIGFITANNLVRFLKSKDWTSFAKGYNGPGYAQNQYDIKLKNAYNKYATASTTHVINATEVQQ